MPRKELFKVILVQNWYSIHLKPLSFLSLYVYKFYESIHKSNKFYNYFEGRFHNLIKFLEYLASFIKVIYLYFLFFKVH